MQKVSFVWHAIRLVKKLMQKSCLNVNAIKKRLTTSESMRIFVLILFVLFAYGPFISGLNMGAADAHWYQYILHDALIQLDHGIFPTYVGQTQFNFFGGSDLRSPYYILFGQLLYILTFGQLNALYIQHLTVLISALMAVFIVYFLLNQLLPEKRWLSLIIAFLYITCPGVIGLIYCCDMYHSFMALPFEPITVYGLVRTHQQNDYLGYCLTAIGLSLATMAHPPIAIWTAGICFFFYMLRIIFIRKGFIAFLIIPSLLLLLNIWQITSIQSLGLRDYLSQMPTPRYVNWMMQTLKNDMRGALLPLGWSSDKAVTPFLQLGYSFWLILIISFVAVFRFTTQFLLRAFLAAVFLLLILLHPIPVITPLLWSLTPISLHALTLWPMQRFYMILATLSLFIAILMLKNFYIGTKGSMKLFIIIGLVLFLCWNSYQTCYFLNFGQKILKGVDNSWLSPDNPYFIANGLLSTHNSINDGHYDPRLKSVLLDDKQHPILNYSNEEVLIKECSKYFKTPSVKMISETQQAFPAQLTQPRAQYLLSLKAPPRASFLLCLKTNLKNAGLSIDIIQSQQDIHTSIRFDETDRLNKRIISMPIFHSGNDKLKVYVTPLLSTASHTNTTSTVTIEAYSLIRYHPDRLPIRIDRYIPFSGNVKTPYPHTYLQLYKEYFPGYQATVNGKKVPVLSSSKQKMVMIPLEKKGNQHIELRYTGTPIMKFTFYINLLAFSIVIFYFSLLVFAKFRTKKVVTKLAATA